MISKLRNFLRDSTAAVAFEAVIITPILAWCFVGSFVFFDAFRTYSASLKATYAVADVLSRQTDTMYATDIEGLADIFVHITRNPYGGSMRVSQLAWDADTSAFSINWSHGSHGETEMRSQDLPGILDQLPVMVDGERVIVVETFIPYRPYFNVGLNDLEFNNFTITRPRFAGQLAYDDGTDPACSSCNAGELESFSSTGSYVPAYDDEDEDD